ncbi:hypothetical protein Tco_1179476 [Tanacetum coccineum]
MACSLSHIVDEIQALVKKLIDEDIVRQKALMELALQFDNASGAKNDLRKVYEKCNDIPQKSRALIDTFLKQESDKDYEMNLAIYRKAAKIKKQIETKHLCNPPTLEKPTEAIPQQPYITPNYGSETHMGDWSSEHHTHQPMSFITDGFLTEKEHQQLLLDGDALRETLEEQARAGKVYDVEPIPEYFTYFRQRYDATGRNNIGTILKCTSAIRQLAYDTAPDAFDEYLQIAERTSREC